jgi:putative membrane protein
MFFYGLHLIAVFSWAIFLMQLLKSVQNNLPDRFIFAFLSLFFMVLVLFFGVKLMLLNPALSKSGGWLHAKLSLALLMMLENVVYAYFAFKSKKISTKTTEILYWVSYVIFVIMLALTMFRPF